MAFLDKVQDAVKIAADMANDAIDTASLKSKINKELKNIDAEKLKIGMIFFDKLKSGEIEADPDLANILEKIEAHEKTIQELKEALSALNSEE